MIAIADIIKEKRSANGYLMLATVDDHTECVLWVAVEDEGEESMWEGDEEATDAWAVTSKQADALVKMGEVECDDRGRRS